MLIKDSEWSNLLTETTHCNITHLSQCGADYPRQKAHSTSNIFWKETLLYFAEFISIVQQKNTQTLLEPLWYNDKIQIQNKSVFYKNMYENGFHLISDLLDEDGKFIKFDDFKHKINKLPFTLYEGLKKAILRSWPDVRNTAANQVLQPYQSSVIRILTRDKKGSRSIYKCFNELSNHRPICELKWETDLGLPTTFNWEKVYKSIMCTTKDTGLIWFALRIIHRIIGTKVYLNKLKISDDKYCSICLHEPESITHLFFDCPLVARIWSSLSFWILQKTGKRIHFDKETVILGHMSDDKIINLIIMLVKKCIFSLSRKKNLITFTDIVRYLQTYYAYEKKCLKLRYFLRGGQIGIFSLNDNSMLFFLHAT